MAKRIVAWGGLLSLALIVSDLKAAGGIEYLDAMGGSQSSARGVNDAGYVTWYSTFTGPQGLSYRSYVRAPGGAAQDIGTLGGTNNVVSRSTWINAAGAIVGWSTPPTGLERAFIRPASGGSVQNAGVNSGNYSRGLTINDAGDIGGFIGHLPAPNNTEKAFIRYANGTVQEFPLLSGAQFMGVTTINNARDAAGYFAAGPTRHSFLRKDSDGVFQQLIEPSGTTGSHAQAMNNRGDIVGFLQFGSTAAHAFVRSVDDGVMHDLGVIAGGTNSSALDIDESGNVVGLSSIAGGGNRATLWLADFTLIDLDAWLDSTNPLAGANWTLNDARALNELGLIVGTGTYNDGAGGLPDGTRGFVLDASSIIPEPSMLVMLPVVLIFRRRRSC